MIEAVLGSINSERVLMYLVCRGTGYATAIASLYKTSLSPIQKQLDKLEHGGVLVSRTEGRTRIYEFNPRYPLINELKAFLQKTLEYYPDDIRKMLTIFRKRPRRRGKPA
jgi:hypothetical protein